MLLVLMTPAAPPMENGNILENVGICRAEEGVPVAGTSGENGGDRATMRLHWLRNVGTIRCPHRLADAALAFTSGLFARMPMQDRQETIAAIATPPGAGAVAIVRLSGPRAQAIAGALFRPSGDAALFTLPPRTLVLGLLCETPEANSPQIDQCLAVGWQAPHSYTGEDVVEFHLHGGIRIVERAMEAVLREGARAAAPGEFTRRAFLNGRLDLAQAEAVADLVRAQTDQAARCALGQLTGGLSARVRELRERVVALTAEVEAYIDFPDEDLPLEDRARQARAMDQILDALDRLMADAQRGRPLREGARVAIAGRPNAGKSSLFNVLLGRERAIVAPHEGTTRDTLEAEVDLEGIATVLVDMAGLRDRPGEIEALGIARAHDEIASADLVVFLLDGSRPFGPEDRAAFERVRTRPHVIVVSKLDLPPAYAMQAVEREFPSEATLGRVHVSVRTRDGVAELERMVANRLRGGAGATAGDSRETPLVANLRHSQALESARTSLCRAHEAHAGRMPFELTAADLRDTIAALGEITGQSDLSEELLDLIFSSFCIGK